MTHHVRPRAQPAWKEVLLATVLGTACATSPSSRPTPAPSVATAAAPASSSAAPGKPEVPPLENVVRLGTHFSTEVPEGWVVAQDKPKLLDLRSPLPPEPEYHAEGKEKWELALFGGRVLILQLYRSADPTDDHAARRKAAAEESSNPEVAKDVWSDSEVSCVEVFMSEGAAVQVACASRGRAVVVVQGTAKSVPAMHALSVAIHAARAAKV